MKFPITTPYYDTKGDTQSIIYDADTAKTLANKYLIASTLAIKESSIEKNTFYQIIHQILPTESAGVSPRKIPTTGSSGVILFH